MKYPLISTSIAQLAKTFGLIRSVEAVRLEGTKPAAWTLLVRGRGFTRILRHTTMPPSASLIRPVGWDRPRPLTFRSLRAAEAHAQSIGLMPRKKTWEVRET